MDEVLSTRILGVPRPAWAVGGYSSGPPAGGNPQILFDKTSPMSGRLRVYKQAYFLPMVVEYSRFVKRISESCLRVG